MKMKEKHIENLSKSRKSGAKIGSRGTPHRLRQYEKKKLDIAMSRGYLEIKSDDRINLINIWEKYAEVKGFRPWIAKIDRKKNITELSLFGEKKREISSCEIEKIQDSIHST